MTEETIKGESQVQSESNGKTDEVGDMIRDIRDSTEMEPPKKKRKMSKQSKSLALKSPLMLVNELIPGLDIRVQDNGLNDLKRPSFRATCTLNDQLFESVESGKRLAKQTLAMKLIESGLMGDIPTDSIGPISGHPNENQASVKSSEDEAKPKIEGSSEDDTSPTKPPSARKSKNDKESLEAKHPLMVFNELHPGCRPELTEEGELGSDRRFKFQATLNDEKFEAFGRNKKLAKTRLAIVALKKVHDLNFAEPPDRKESASSFSEKVAISPASNPHSALADRISALVNAKHQQLVASLDHKITKSKVVAGVVMTTDENMEECTLICLTTGTKAISGQNLSQRGETINDCHAEILARRALIRFLLEQINALADETLGSAPESGSSEPQNGKRPSDIFGIEDNGLCCLKPNVKFHLYISTAPCGDARLFSPRESSMADPHPNRQCRCQLRMKIESGEGTVLLPKELSTQTWDGVLGGDRLLTMSCSDKILSWNVTGLQGALLSQVMSDPIYLSSICLGSLYNREHLQRAVSSRAKYITDLPKNYKVNELLLAGTTFPEKRVARKAGSYAIVWSCLNDKPEVLNTTSGLLETGNPASICKRNLYEAFVRLHKALGTKTSEMGKNYAVDKMSSNDYQAAKKRLEEFCAEKGFGRWVHKPREQDQFSIESS